MERSFKDRVLALATIAVLLISVGASLVYTHFATQYPNSVLLRNYYINGWFCLVLAFLAFQSLLLQSQRPATRQSKAFVIANNSYHIGLAILFLETSAGWDFFGRADVGVWSVSCIAFCILNIYVVSSKNNDNKRRSRSPQIKPAKKIEPLTETSALISTSESSEDSIEDLERERQLQRQESRKSCLLSCCSSANSLMKLLVLIVCGFLFNGAFLHGIGQQNFQPKEEDFVQLRSGYKVFYRCAGNDTTHPTIFLHGNVEQSSADFLGTFDLLSKKEELRVCIWDPPGLGYSDYIYPFDSRRSKEEIFDLLQAFSKQNQTYSGPYFFVGFEDGGNVLRALSSEHPELVQHLLLVNTLKPKFYQRAVKAALEASKKKYSEPVIRGMIEASYMKEYRLFQFFNAFGIPFGLTKFMVPPRNTSSWNAISAQEQRFTEVTEKSWLARLWHSQELEESSIDEASNTSNASVGMTVNVLISEWNDEQVERLVCRPQRLSNEACEVRKAMAKLASEERRGMVEKGGKVFECLGDECKRDYFLYDDPGYLVEKIKEILALSV